MLGPVYTRIYSAYPFSPWREKVGMRGILSNVSNSSNIVARHTRCAMTLVGLFAALLVFLRNDKIARAEVL